MLKASRFEGSESDLVEHADRFWNEFGPAMATAPGGAVGTSKNLDTIDDDKRRKIRFYDTKNDLLDMHDYVFRLREQIKGKRREVTLKFRQRKLPAAQAADMEPAGADGADCNDIKGFKCKFEEDIKRESSIVSLYSVSTTKKIDSGKKINRMSDAGKIVPGLQQALNEEYEPEKRLRRVGKYTARELVLTGGELVMSAHPQVKVECAFVVWYDNSDKRHQRPDVAEFSFKYDEQIGDEALRNQCNRVLTILGTEMTDWIDPAQTTKTRFVYAKQQ
jgi:hypothetical protein